MSVNDVTAFLTAEEQTALLPLRTKWRRELVSVDDQLRTLTNRRSELARMLASLNGILPPDDDPTPSVPVPQREGPVNQPAAGAATATVVAPSAPDAIGGRKRFAPVEAYWLPTLLALVELGGRARRDEVVELVGKKMQNVLTPDDKDLLPSGVEVRWKNRVAWQRENMKRRGLLRGDSPSGIWEVTEAGRQWLQDVLSRRSFFTLAALRIGNLSGAQPHPVTMGGYRNFVRQYAQDFGDPTLGEADDHVLTDPMVVLWKQGCMELKKYDLSKNEWWDFAKLQEIRLLVGTGGWTIKLTAEGRAELAKMEEQAKLMSKDNTVRFHG
jgi:Mrr N-terminal domain